MVRYHVWRLDRRRRLLWMVTAKSARGDPGIRVPAVWETRTAANAYAADHFGRGNFRVFQCEDQLCGMGAHD